METEQIVGAKAIKGVVTCHIWHQLVATEQLMRLTGLFKVGKPRPVEAESTVNPWLNLSKYSRDLHDT